jgi:hypothetical protein
MHAFTWPDWQPLTGPDGLPYGPGSLCLQKAILPRPSLAVDSTAIRFDCFELEFNPAYQPCDLMPFVEVCDIGRHLCRDLLGLEAKGKLQMINPDNTPAYKEQTGFGTWRHYLLRGDHCILQPIPVLMARTLFGHVAVSLVTQWTLNQTCGTGLPPWLVHGLAAYVADEGVHLSNYMAEFRSQGPVLLPPQEIDAILGAQPHPDPNLDRRQFRQATYSAFLMVWDLVENNGGLEPLRKFLGGLARGESLEAGCKRIYHTNLVGLATRLDPVVKGEPIGEAVQPRKPHIPPQG